MLTLNKEEFLKDLNEIEKFIETKVSKEDDFKHFRKFEIWGRICALIGYSTAWIFPNPFSAFFIAQSNLSRWMVQHFISHKTFDTYENVKDSYKSYKFASGNRRYIDWLDWIYPEAWHIEHDVMHHYRLGEKFDPDQLENNLKNARGLYNKIFTQSSNITKYVFVFIFSMIWKIIYYAPNTYKIYSYNKHQKYSGFKFFLTCYLPYGLFRFILLPSLFLPFGIKYAVNVLITSIFAEIFTNMHSFLVIGPNHTGEDVYSFDSKFKDSQEFYIRQIIGSVNYKTGNDLNDFLHAFLNYQIEHHIWPTMSPKKLQIAQPMVKLLCEKHNIPYIQESVFKRYCKLLNVFVGKKKTIRVEGV